MPHFGELRLPYKVVRSAAGIQPALNGLTAGRTWKEKVLCLGNFTIPATILVPSYTWLEIHGTWTLADNVDADMIQNDDVAGGNTQIEIIGGILDGNKANQAANCSSMRLENITDSFIRDLWVRNWYYHGAELWAIAENCWFINCLATANTNDGYEIYGDNVIFCGATRCTSRDNVTATGGGFHAYGDFLSFQDCLAIDNASYGFEFGTLQYSTILGCIATGNVNGFGLGTNSIQNVLSGNIANVNASNGFRVSASDYNLLVANQANSNTGPAPGGNGFLLVDSDYNLIKSSYARLNQQVGIRVHDAASTGNRVRECDLTGNIVGTHVDDGTNTDMADNWLV